MKIGIFFLLSIVSLSAISQDQTKLCKCVAKGKFKKIEHILKRHVNRMEDDGGENKGYPGPSMTENLDSLESWLRSMPCVEDVFRDKCQNKILIYPGWSIIGVKFKTNSGIAEKCFTIQEGTLGTINIFGWRPRVSESKNKLVYKSMTDCPGFVEEQRRACAGGK